MKTIEEEFPPEFCLDQEIEELSDAYTRLRARAVELERAQQWRPIAEAPVIAGLHEQVPRCLVWSSRVGVQMGHAFVQDGEPYASADGYNGEWGFTHFRPLPPAPDTHQPTD